MFGCCGSGSCPHMTSRQIASTTTPTAMHTRAPFKHACAVRGFLYRHIKYSMMPARGTKKPITMYFHKWLVSALSSKGVYRSSTGGGGRLTSPPWLLPQRGQTTEPSSSCLPQYLHRTEIPPHRFLFSITRKISPSIFKRIFSRKSLPKRQNFCRRQLSYTVCELNHAVSKKSVKVQDVYKY